MVHLGFGPPAGDARATRATPHVQRTQTMLIATGVAWLAIVGIAGAILSLMV